MTKKDYIAIAACIKTEWDSRRLDQPQEQSRCRAIYSLMNRIAVELAIDNPRFDRDKFEKACGF